MATQENPKQPSPLDKFMLTTGVLDIIYGECLKHASMLAMNLPANLAIKYEDNYYVVRSLGSGPQGNLMKVLNRVPADCAKGYNKDAAGVLMRPHPSIQERCLSLSMSTPYVSYVVPNQAVTADGQNTVELDTFIIERDSHQEVIAFLKACKSEKLYAAAEAAAETIFHISGDEELEAMVDAFLASAVPSEK